MAATWTTDDDDAAGDAAGDAAAVDDDDDDPRNQPCDCSSFCYYIRWVEFPANSSC